MTRPQVCLSVDISYIGRKSFELLTTAFLEVTLDTARTENPGEVAIPAYPLPGSNSEACVIVNPSSSDPDIIASDHDKELPPSLSYSSVVVGSPRATALAILPAQQRLTRIPHASRKPIGRNRATSKHHWKLKSQERAGATKEKEIRAKREATKARKDAKLMTPRKEDVSQLEKEIRMPSFSLD